MGCLLGWLLNFRSNPLVQGIGRGLVPGGSAEGPQIPRQPRTDSPGSRATASLPRDLFPPQLPSPPHRSWLGQTLCEPNHLESFPPCRKLSS
ncbi:hypothetical protein V5799_030323 [Amblyomma americanum]|uniref:Uncharacterized protein n=1 Tax=Amblyomma americanum TaxID=6943 RepID=A0AAQ4ENK4_AMBAM